MICRDSQFISAKAGPHYQMEYSGKDLSHYSEMYFPFHNAI